MALKKDGDKVKKTVIFDNADYNKLTKIAKENKDKQLKELNNIGKLVRDAIKKYLAPNEIDILTRYTKKELINYFTIEEAELIIACLNGTMYEVNTINPKAVLIGNVEDSIVLEGYDSYYKVDKKIILNKLYNLSEFQCYLVIKMVSEFWNLPINERQGEKMILAIKRIFLI